MTDTFSGSAKTLFVVKATSAPIWLPDRRALAQDASAYPMTTVSSLMGMSCRRIPRWDVSFPGGRVLILINIAKKILISIVFQYRVLIFQALKSIRKSIKKASKSQPKINTGTAAKMQVVFQIACLWSVGIGNYFVDSCLYMLYTCQNLSHNGPFVEDQWSHHFSFM